MSSVVPLTKLVGKKILFRPKSLIKRGLEAKTKETLILHHITNPSFGEARRGQRTRRAATRVLKESWKRRGLTTIDPHYSFPFSFFMFLIFISMLELSIVVMSG